MSFLVSRNVSAMLLLLACFVCGCVDSNSDPLEEEREPHYLDGVNRLRDLDYKGAIESFQKTLEINPRHAKANFQLGMIYDQKEPDPAIAIYHYTRYLELQPNGGQQDTAKGRIMACKQELARTVSLGPVTQTLQREFENLSEENKRLRDELEKWRVYATQLQSWSNQIVAQASAAQLQAAQAQAQALAGRTSATPASTPGRTPVTQPPQRPQVPPTAVPNPVSPARTFTPQPGSRSLTPSTPAYRSHTVKAGETPSIIARNYGISVNSLMSANPRIDPRRMKVGTTLRIPPS